MTDKKKKAKKFPIIECFGPTVQGEGVMCGKVTYFIRSGGCDFKCKMCDSMHAVDPVQVKQNRTLMTAREIVRDIKALDLTYAKAEWVTLSGGNPLMWDYSELIVLLHDAGYKVAVETQGTLYKDWLQLCDVVTISPKGPGMGETYTPEQYKEFTDKLRDDGGALTNSWVCLKIPVFNTDDLEFAKSIWEITPKLNLFLSVGNLWLPESNTGDGELRDNLMCCYRDLVESCMKDPIMCKAVILPQLHVLAWGNEQGR